MPKHEFSIVIDRPVSDVFDFVENPANDPIWRTGMIAADVESAGPVSVGTTGHEVYRYLGRDIETTWGIIDFTINQQVAYRTTSSPVTYEGSLSYETVEGRYPHHLAARVVDHRSQRAPPPSRRDLQARR